MVEGTDAGVPGVLIELRGDPDNCVLGSGSSDRDGRFEIECSGGALSSAELTARGAADTVAVSVSDRSDGDLVLALAPADLVRLLPAASTDRARRQAAWRTKGAARDAWRRERMDALTTELGARRKRAERTGVRLDLSTLTRQEREADSSHVDATSSRDELRQSFLVHARQSLQRAPRKSLRVSRETLGDIDGAHFKLDFAKLAAKIKEVARPELDVDALHILRELQQPVRDMGLTGRPIGEPSPPAAEPTSEPAQEEPEAVDYVARAIRRLTLLDAAGSLDFGERGDAATVTRDIDQVALKGGPSDVTSYHDYKNLRIAFEPVWTEIFGAELAKAADALLTSLPVPERADDVQEPGSLDSLRPLLDLAEELGVEVDEPPQDPVPDGVATLLPSLPLGDWNRLPPADRVTLEDIAHRYEESPLFEPGPTKSWPFMRNPPTGVDTHNVPFDPQAAYILLNGHGLRVDFDGRSWIDATQVENLTDKDITIEAVPVPVIQRAGTLEKYINPPPSSASEVEIEAKIYVEASTASARLLTAFRDEARTALAAAKARLATETTPGSPVAASKLEVLARILDNPDGYRFKVFPAGSINFGILLTYRQEWTPLNYQVGDLVKTMPLAPKEVRRYKERTVVKKSRSRKEIERALTTKSDSSEDSGRSEAEIVRRAKNASNFQATAEGKGSIGVVEFGGSMSAQTSAEKESARTKKKFRKAVQKAAHEYRLERTLEVDSVDSEDSETTSSGEISNPNEEITVTYLFYELQRRYRLREQLVEVRPVILIANEVPDISRITETWLLRHDWILKRILLDDGFLSTFELLKESNRAREMRIEVLHGDLVRKANAFEEIKEQLTAATRLRAEAAKRLRAAIDARVDAINAVPPDAAQAVDVGMTIFSGGLLGSSGLLGGVGGTGDQGAGFDNPEAAEARQEAVEEALARASEEARRLRVLLDAAELAVDQAIEKYSKAVQNRLDKELAVMRLRLHIAQNIFHYMQGIWEYEPVDQRYFRLFNMDVPVIGGDVEVTVNDDDDVTVSFDATGVDLANPAMAKLVEVADLDDLLGYRGNYMIFPLREHNYVTAWMVQDYLDPDGWVEDPDRPFSVTSDEIRQLVDELMQQTLDGRRNDAEFERITAVLRQRIAKEGVEETDEIVVPSDMLFIEALPGTHPLLEDFKLKHRSLDVARAATDIRAAEIENIRRIARLLRGDYSDADIDKQVVIQGESPMIVDTK